MRLTERSLRGKTLKEVFEVEWQETCIAYVKRRVRQIKLPFDDVVHEFLIDDLAHEFLTELLEVADTVWNPNSLKFDRRFGYNPSFQILPFGYQLAVQCLDGLSEAIESFEKWGIMDLDSLRIEPPVEELLPKAIAALAAGIRPLKYEKIIRYAAKGWNDCDSTTIKAAIFHNVLNSRMLMKLHSPSLQELVLIKEEQLGLDKDLPLREMVSLVCGLKEGDRDIGTLLLLRSLLYRKVAGY